MGSSFCYPVEVWFYGPRFYEYTVCGFLGNDNCNDNDSGNGNGNGGKKLGDSTVYGATMTTTSARIPWVYGFVDAFLDI